VAHERDFPIGKAPKLGAKVKCPNCRKKSAARIVSEGIQGIVRGKAVVDWRHGQSVIERLPDGQEVKMTFVDHPHTSTEYQRNLAHLAKKEEITAPNVSALSKAYYSEKHDRLVVDVHSNVKDPLGTIERNKKNISVTKRHVGQKVKIRGQK
jgi:hypothetical protein